MIIKAIQHAIVFARNRVVCACARSRAYIQYHHSNRNNFAQNGGY